MDGGALPHLVAVRKRHRDGQNSRAVNGVIRRAADANDLKLHRVGYKFYRVGYKIVHCITLAMNRLKNSLKMAGSVQ